MLKWETEFEPDVPEPAELKVAYAVISRAVHDLNARRGTRRRRMAVKFLMEDMWQGDGRLWADTLMTRMPESFIRQRVAQLVVNTRQ